MIASIAAMIPAAAAGTFALAAIIVSWMRYAPLALGLRSELAACPTTRELRFVVITMRVSAGDRAAEGESLDAVRPAERLARYQPIHRQARRPAPRLPLRVAA